MKKSSIREQRPSVTARETAVATSAAAKPTAKRPDFVNRLRTVNGGKVLPTTATEMISEERVAKKLHARSALAAGVTFFSPTAERPDFAARLKNIYGDKVLLPTTGAEIISELRGDR